MLIPGIDYVPLAGLDTPGLYDPNIKTKEFMSLYVNHVKPHSTYRNYFNRYDHGRIYRTVKTLFKEYVLNRKLLTPVDFSAILEEVYKSEMILTPGTFAAHYKGYKSKDERIQP